MIVPLIDGEGQETRHPKLCANHQHVVKCSTTVDALPSTTCALLFGHLERRLGPSTQAATCSHRLSQSRSALFEAVS